MVIPCGRPGGDVEGKGAGSRRPGGHTGRCLLGVDVVIVVTNLFLSLRGTGWFPRDPALRFVGTATMFYLIVSIQGSLQAQMSINQSVHFTDWVVGHSHMAMLGFASFAALGGLVHAWQRIPWARYHAGLINHGYWLLLAGVIVMMIDLTIAGLVEASQWKSAAPWIDSVRAAKPYWLVRAITFVPIAAGFLTVMIGLFAGQPGDGLKAIRRDIGLEPVDEIAPRLAQAAS